MTKECQSWQRTNITIQGREGVREKERLYDYSFFSRSGYKQSGNAGISTECLPCVLLGMSYWGDWESWGSLQGEVMEALGEGMLILASLSA